LCAKGKEFYEPPFALHRQQPGKDKQNISVSPLKKILQTPMVLVVYQQTPLNP